MADDGKTGSLKLGETALRVLVTDTLTEIVDSPEVPSEGGLRELLMDYGFSTRSKAIALEPQVLTALTQAGKYLEDGEPKDLRERVLGTIDAVLQQQKLRAALAQPPRMVVVEIHSSLIEDLRAEAEDMELNTLGVVPGPVAAVLAVLEAAAESDLAEDAEISAIARERIAAGEAIPLDDIARKLGVRLIEALPKGNAGADDFADEEKIPLIEGMAVRSRNDLDDDGDFSFSIPAGFLWVIERVQGDSIELGSRTIPGVGLNMNRKDFWRAFSFASDVVQPGEVLAEIRRLAVEERTERNAELRSEIGSTISQSVSKVTESAAKLSERYGPVGERFFKRAVTAAKSAVETVSSRVEEATVETVEKTADGDSSKVTESQVLDEAFSGEGFAESEDHEVDLQALREKLSSTPKAPASTTGSRSGWSQPRDQLAQLIYDAQHPANGSKWLTTVDGSPNVVSYEAADAVLARFSGLVASSDDGAQSGAENSSERSTADGQNGLQSPGTEHGSEEEDSDSKIEDFPLPVPPAESDLGRLRYLQRALDLDDFEDSFRRDDTLAELLELLPNALDEISYLRDNEGEVQKSFLDTLEKLRGAVSTSSVRHAWEAYEGARESRNLIYQSRQEERAKVRRLEDEIEELRAKLDSSEDDRRSAAEKLAAWTDEADRKEREVINGSSVKSYNRWAENQRELGHVSSFMVSGIPMAVRISEQEGTTLKLLELIPQESESPLFRKEICATGFLTEEKLRRIVADSDGWLGNDAVEATSQSDPVVTEGDSSEDENEAEGNDR